MASPIGAPAQFDVPAAFEHTIEDRLGQIRVVQYAAPRRQGLVGGEDHGPVVQVPIVDDLEEDVGGIGPIAEVADFIDDEDVGMRVARQRLPQLPIACGPREIFDQGGRRGEEGIEAILDGAVGDRDREMRLAGAARPAEDEGLPLGDEVGAEGTAEQREPDGGLKGEVVLIDRLEKREVGPMHAPLDAGLRAVRDLLGHQQPEKLAIRHALGFRALGELGIEPAHGGQMQAAQEALEIDGGGDVSRHAPAARTHASWVRMYSAPMAPCATPHASARRTGPGP